MDAPVARHLAVAGATRPYPGETANGDTWLVDWHGGACRIAVVDGLGHGPEAAAAAQAARDTLTAAPQLGPEAALRACHRALHGTRGAAISIARIDPAAATLTYAGVGNVEGYLWQPRGSQRPIVHRGIVGATVPRLKAFEFALEADWCLLVHTDGVSARFDLELLPEFSSGRPGNAQGLAAAVLARWGRQTDDATVVVACPIWITSEVRRLKPGALPVMGRGT